MLEAKIYNPVKIVFGVGCVREVGKYASRLGRKALIVTTSGGSMRKHGFLDIVSKSLEEHGVRCAIFDGVKTNPTTEIADEGTRVALRENVDVIIGLGGGSAIDVAKAIAVTAASGGSSKEYLYIYGKQPGKALPIIAIPTTHGTGSEVDRYAVLTDEERKAKVSIVSDLIYPRVALLDPKLTVTLPPRLTAATTVDALAHSLEAYVARYGNRMAQIYAVEAIKEIFGNAVKAYANGKNLEARARLLWASMLAGLAINIGRTCLPHALEHPISAFLGIHHGEGLAALLPTWIKRGLKEKIFNNLAVELGLKDADELYEKVVSLLKSIGMNVRLGEHGLTEDMVEKLVGNAWTYLTPLIENNPYKVSREETCKMLLNTI
ncbi:MAG TPA: iron-containing alcohol dehydrogenase [Candidatus Bathyarchaeota archaeon]|nr:iron-containing alcohol dehydrogenase [Candidatus Bathyarchaeota archaeon]